MQTIKIHCKYDKLIPIESFVTHEKNANKHPQKQIDLLARLIKFQGVRHPIIISNLSGKCVAGHGRYEALKLLDFKQIPVVYQDFDDVHQEIAFLVSDNKIQELAETDQDILNSLALEMPDDFDLDLLGIPDLELSLPDPDKEAIQDEVPEINFKTRSKLGDIYELGEHRLMCGDSTDKDTVEKLMNGEKADMVFTDPPYGMNLDSDWSNAKSEKWADFRPNQGPKSGDNKGSILGDGTDFKKELIDAIFTIECKELFIWGSDYFCEHITNKNNGSWVVWDKTHSSEGLDKMYGSNFELCWSKNKHKRELARITWKGVFGRDEGKAGHKILHPTQKPVKLAEWFFERWGKETVKVVDLFGGSGSTLIACEKTNRKCFMMELDPHYVDVIVSRWCKYTGKNNIKLNGKETIWTIDETKN